jgi:hypothetical protein
LLLLLLLLPRVVNDWCWEVVIKKGIVAALYKLSGDVTKDESP